MTTARPGFLTQLGWRWRVLPGHSVAHLVPGTIAPGTRTACFRYPVLADITLWEPTVADDVPRCPRCQNHDA